MCYNAKAVSINILPILTTKGFPKLAKNQNRAEAWGTEVVIEVAKKAKDQVDNILTGKVEDMLGSIPDNYFDCITFNDVLEHLLEPADVLKMIEPKLS